MDEILNLIQSVSEGFPTYSFKLVAAATDVPIAATAVAALTQIMIY